MRLMSNESSSRMFLSLQVTSVPAKDVTTRDFEVVLAEAVKCSVYKGSKLPQSCDAPLVIVQELWSPSQ